MERYSKLIAAILGLVVLVGNRHFGVDLGPEMNALSEVLIAGATAFGVYMVSNKETV
jgi:hypothetical protein